MQLGIIISLSFLSLLICRPFLYRFFITEATESIQARRAFIIDFSICILAGIIISIRNRIVLEIPIFSLLSLFIGCIIAGFFIGLDSALSQERSLILSATKKKSSVRLSKRFYPLTRRFTLIAVTASVFVAMVLILVFTRDVEWLAASPHTEQALYDAQLSVITEIIFIISVLMILIVNLIFSYSRNLSLLFQNQTKVLELVRKGDLHSKVPVVTHDEFGVIASHTNHMIDGLRHRFDLISSLKLAEEVQQNLLPDSSPYLENFDISGTSIYCEQTGGDYYDYFTLPDNKLAIVVADACGHGVGAALLMSSVRAFIASAISDYNGPAPLLNKINGHITRDCSKTSRFTSMFFLEIDEKDRKMKWVRAGHEPPLHYCHKTGIFSKLEGSGLVLGIDEDCSYQEYNTSGLQSGDILLIGTDGIRESTNNTGSFFGDERIEAIIRNSTDLSAKEIEKRIISEVEQFRDGHAQEDDITLVTIKGR